MELAAQGEAREEWSAEEGAHSSQQKWYSGGRISVESKNF
jgi:hypothetical protein